MNNEINTIILKIMMLVKEPQSNLIKAEDKVQDLVKEALSMQCEEIIAELSEHVDGLDQSRCVQDREYLLVVEDVIDFIKQKAKELREGEDW